MPLKFYFVPNSTSNVTAAILAELEQGLPTPLAERIKLSIQDGDTKTPHFLSTVNPNGRVPSLVHDGVSIWESAAITMYLGETFGVGAEDSKTPLYPPLGPKRGEAMKWIVWTNINLAVPGSRLAASQPAGTPGGAEEGSQDFVAEGEKTEGEGQKAMKDISSALGVLNSGLDGRDYLLGGVYCLADTHVWCFVSWLALIGVGLDTYANVKAWMVRVGDRPALKPE